MYQTYCLDVAVDFAYTPGIPRLYGTPGSCEDGSHYSIVPSPGLNFPFRILQRQKPVSIQALVPEAPVEALDDGIVRRLPGPGEAQAHATLIGPPIRILRHELGTVITENCLRQVTGQADNLQHFRDPFHVLFFPTSMARHSLV